MLPLCQDTRRSTHRLQGKGGGPTPFFYQIRDPKQLSRRESVVKAAASLEDLLLLVQLNDFDLQREFINYHVNRQAALATCLLSSPPRRGSSRLLCDSCSSAC